MITIVVCCYFVHPSYMVEGLAVVDTVAADTVAADTVVKGFVAVDIVVALAAT